MHRLRASDRDRRSRSVTAVDADVHGADDSARMHALREPRFTKLSVVHAAGVSLSEGTAKGLGVSLGGSIGVGAAGTSNVNQTMRSAAAAPPEARGILIRIVFGIFVVASFVSTAMSRG